MLKKMFLVMAVLFCFVVSANALPIYVGDTDTLDIFGYDDHNDQDTTSNVNKLVYLYNSDSSNDPYPIPENLFKLDEVEYIQPPELKFGDISGFISGTEYVSLKYDGVFELWYLNGSSQLNYGPWDYALSHHREWGTIPFTTTVPEPQSLFLLGSGLLSSMYIVRRKSLKNK